jgi:hypothetical protein
MDQHQKHNSITNSTFHVKLPDDDPAGLKRAAMYIIKRIIQHWLFVTNLLC